MRGSPLPLARKRKAPRLGSSPGRERDGRPRPVGTRARMARRRDLLAWRTRKYHRVPALGGIRGQTRQSAERKFLDDDPRHSYSGSRNPWRDCRDLGFCQFTGGRRNESRYLHSGDASHAFGDFGAHRHEAAKGDARRVGPRGYDLCGRVKSEAFALGPSTSGVAGGSTTTARRRFGRRGAGARSFPVHDGDKSIVEDMLGLWNEAGDNLGQRENDMAKNDEPSFNLYLKRRVYKRRAGREIAPSPARRRVAASVDCARAGGLFPAATPLPASATELGRATPAVGARS